MALFIMVGLLIASIMAFASNATRAGFVLLGIDAVVFFVWLSVKRGQYHRYVQGEIEHARIEEELKRKQPAKKPKTQLDRDVIIEPEKMAGDSISVMEVAKELIETSRKCIEITQEQEFMKRVKDWNRLIKELLYLQFLAVDFTLHMASMEGSQKKLVRDKFSECWYGVAEKMFDPDVVDEELNQRLGAYLPVVTQGGEGYHEKLGYIFSEFCCGEKDIELAMYSAGIFHNIMGAVLKYVVPLSKEYKFI